MDLIAAVRSRVAMHFAEAVRHFYDGLGALGGLEWPRYTALCPGDAKAARQQKRFIAALRCGVSQPTYVMRWSPRCSAQPT
jgi:hypothetical protein